MIKIVVNGKVAALKQGISFDYVSENRLFLGRDGYTLNISFPLRGCPQNLDIFGHLDRMDVAKGNVRYQSLIVSDSVSLAGMLLVTKVSDVEVDCQFAVGRCAQTIEDPFGDIYVNQLDLGKPIATAPSAITPFEAWTDRGEAVALPWINEAYPTSPNNWVTYDGEYHWHPDLLNLSWMPYLLEIAKRICTAIGYRYDFTPWEYSDYRYLIICNTLPASWGMSDYKYCLPHWTVTEFFEKLELFLCCEFEFDNQAHTVSMRFSSEIIKATRAVCIRDVVDSYQVEIATADKDNCDYIAAKRLAYKARNHSLWNFYACDWFMSSDPDVVKYDTLDELLQKNKRVQMSSGGVVRVFWGEPPYRGSYGDSARKILYAKDVDTYFCFRSIGTELLGETTNGPYYTQVHVIQPVNVFGSGCPESDELETKEIEFVPAIVLETYVSPQDDMGRMLAMSYSASNEGDGAEGSYRPVESSDITQLGPASAIAAGEDSGGSVYFDDVAVAFWDGRIPEPGKPPYPIVDAVTVTQAWQHISRKYSMRLSGTWSDYTSSLPQIDPKRKFSFSWLADSIPDARAIYYIRGKRYLCEKITATFTENGMSQLLKGEFYPLIED